MTHYQAGGLTPLSMKVSAPADFECLGLIGESGDDQKTEKKVKKIKIFIKIV